MNLPLICQILLCFHSVPGLHIHLLKFEQSNCLTACKSGLISGFDTVVFKSNVSFDVNGTTDAVFYVRKVTEQFFHMRKKISIQEVCHDMIHCSMVNQNEAIIDVPMQAFNDLSGATIIGKLISNNLEEATSESQVFPTISDSWNVALEVIINGKKIDTHHDSCHYICDDKPPVTVNISCTSEVLPCWIEILYDNSHTKNDTYATFEINRRNKLHGAENFEIIYSPCKLDHTMHTHTKTCTIEFDAPGKSNELNITILVGPILFFLIIASLVLILTILSIKSMRRRRTIPNKKSRELPISLTLLRKEMECISKTQGKVIRFETKFDLRSKGCDTPLSNSSSLYSSIYISAQDIPGMMDDGRH